MGVTGDEVRVELGKFEVFLIEERLDFLTFFVLDAFLIFLIYL